MAKAENLFFLFFCFHFLGSSRRSPDVCLLSLSLVSLEGGGKAAKRNMEKVRAEHMQIAIQAQLEQQQKEQQEQQAKEAKRRQQCGPKYKKDALTKG